MKRILPILFIASCVLTSCLDVESNYQPGISVSYFVNQNKDTVQLHFNTEKNSNVLDTIYVGDTINFIVGYGSFANNLVNTSLTADEDIIDLYINLSSESLAILDMAKSDTAAHNLWYQEGYNYVAAPVRMIPRKEGSSKVVFFVQSDANTKEVTNTYSAEMMVNVKDTLSATE